MADSAKMDSTSDPVSRTVPNDAEAIRWTGDNIDAVIAFMAPQEPVHVNSLSHLRFTNADDLVGIETTDGLAVASKGDWIVRDPDGHLRAHGPCPAALLPLNADPVEHCVERPPHKTHRTAAGETWTDDVTSQEEEPPVEAHPTETTFRIETYDGDLWLPIGYPRPTLEEARLVRDNRRARMKATPLRIVEWTAAARVVETDEVPAGAEAGTA
jgi:hypothetical protein